MPRVACASTRARSWPCAPAATPAPPALKEALEQIEETGALVKDLDIGLIDFLSRFQDRDVCLCWKLGETGIGFWHGVEEGFRGRKPIDQEFLRRPFRLEIRQPLAIDSLTFRADRLIEEGCCSLESSSLTFRARSSKS